MAVLDPICPFIAKIPIFDIFIYYGLKNAKSDIFWQNILKLVSWVLMMIWVAKQLISTGFCIQIIKGQKLYKTSIVGAESSDYILRKTLRNAPVQCYSLRLIFLCKCKRYKKPRWQNIKSHFFEKSSQEHLESFLSILFTYYVQFTAYFIMKIALVSYYFYYTWLIFCT